MTDDMDDVVQSERAKAVEQAFLALLERSGLTLQTLDPMSATRAALEFYRDVKFDWVAAPENDDDVPDEFLVEIEAQHAKAEPTNFLQALFSAPKKGPLEAIALSFERDLVAQDGEDVFFYLELSFAPDGLEALEDMSLYADDHDSLEEFARELLTDRSMQALAVLPPVNRSLDVL